MVTKANIERIVKAAIKEDVGKRDITTSYLVSSSSKIKAQIIAQEDLVLCGLFVSREVFKEIDPKVVFKPLKKEGSLVKKGTTIASIKGRAQSILKAERVALNFLVHLCGVASEVRHVVNIAKKYKVKILDTRKTIPTLRFLQKYAVRIGGGYNHRHGLWDAVMIKDNHIISGGLKKGHTICKESLNAIIKNIKKATSKKVEVEVETLGEFKVACACSPDIILLDNFSPRNARKAVLFRNKHYPSIILEASGGIDSTNIARFAATGVDCISLGILTHSPRAKDISLEIV